MLLIVVAVFVAPILAAWWLAHVAPPGDDRLLNHGTLLRPPLDIRATDELAALRAIPLAPGEWAMIYFTPGSCAEACTQAVDMLERIRSLLSHDATRVRIAVVTDTPSATAVPGAVADASARARLAAAAPAGAAPGSGIVFLDWRGQLMLYFPDAAQPADIKDDLKRLLRGSKID